MMGGFGRGLWGMGGFGLIGMIVNLAITLGLILALVLLIAWLWRRVNAGPGRTVSGQSTAAPASPKEIVQIRYAQGEITREQYQQMLADLS
jgi:uncharacterized membrane protein